MTGKRFVKLLLTSFIILESDVLCYLTSSQCLDLDHGVDIPTRQPLIIAHRGSSGVLPEHTVAAYEKAVEDGADVIECDLCVTSDLELVCRHESWLSSTTDIASRPEFENRTNTYVVEILPRVPAVIANDWFTVDFTLAELKRVRAEQANGRRDQSRNGQLEIATFDEYVQVAQNANRTVGLHVELKQPTWVNSILESKGTTMEELLLDKLENYGYVKPSDPCFIQSFFKETLVGLANQTELPLVMLIGTNVPDGELEEWAELGFYGVGALKTMIVDHNTIESGDKSWIQRITDFVDRCHSYGLRVHPYTFKNEDSTLAWDYEQDPYNEYALYYDLQVDGMFSDFPATMYRFIGSLDCPISK